MIVDKKQLIDYLERFGDSYISDDEVRDAMREAEVEWDYDNDRPRYDGED